MKKSMQYMVYRSFHRMMKTAVRRIPIPLPAVLSGAGSVEKLAENIKLRALKRPLVVTDKTLSAIGLVDRFYNALNAQGIAYCIYDDVDPNPTIQNVEQGVGVYRQSSCDSIVGFGGGSVMDCAKIIGARVGNPFLSIHKMHGYLRLILPVPPLFCVPTTAGTGSETTIVAVIRDVVTREKFAITDLKFIPKIAVLDPELTVGLSPSITAATGMDALTHAVEAFVGINGNAFTDAQAIRATQLILQYLPQVYRDGADQKAREHMAVASFCAGAAFTRAFVGYVHAIAHNVGALYNVAHGLANAIALAPVLKFYGSDVHQKLAQLAVACNIGPAFSSSESLANAFISRIEQMNQQMGIGTRMPQLQRKDIKMLAQRILREAHPDYPVPRFMSLQQCENILISMLDNHD